jgi:outer membrane protein TolC
MKRGLPISRSEEKIINFNHKTMKKLIVLHMFALFAMAGWAQEATQQPTDSVFTLQSAIDYAMEHNYDVQKAELEVIKAKKKVWETTAIGLPQVSASLDANYMLTVPEALEQFSNIEGIFTPVFYSLNQVGALTDDQYNAILSNMASEPVSTDDIRWGATLDITVSQLIFSGSYIVGLQASKTYQSLSKYLEQQSVADLKEIITNAYAGVLIAEESMTVLEEILESTKSSIKEMEAMLEEGFIENTDVDQLKLTAATIETNLKNLELQLKIAKEMLKLSMGMDLESPIVLEDDLDKVMLTNNVTNAKGLEFDVTQNIQYQLLETQEKLGELDVKLSKAEFLPTIAAYYNHQENFNDNSFVLQPPDVIGVNVSIPIFTSWSRMSVLKQKEISLEQTRLDKAKATNGLNIQYRNNLNGYYTARNTYENNKSNMELAKKIYEKTEMKYKEGISTSFDLSQAQGQYLQSQANYFQSTMELISAKSALDKLLHQYEPINN